MKTFKIILIVTLTLFFVISITSCFVVYEKDNGKHKGWYKNPNNPHHPNTTNPGKSKGKHHK